MGDYSIFAHPDIPDYAGGAASVANTANVLNGLRQKQEEQAVQEAAGQAIAQGDLLGAENLYNRAGKVDAANVIKQRRINIEAGQLAAKGDITGAAKLHLENGYYDAAHKMTADQLTATNNTQAKIAAIADDPQLTPERWNQALDILIQHDPSQRANIEGFRDFKTGPKVAIDVAGKVQDHNDAILKQRKAEMEENKAGYLVNVSKSLPVSGPTQEGAPPLPPVVVQGTARKSLTTGQPLPETFTEAPADIQETGAAVADASKVSHAANAEGIRAMQTRFKSETGKDLPYEIASSALRSGSGVELSPEGEPRLKALAHSMQATREGQLATKEKSLDLGFLYNKALAAGMGKQDAQNLGRVQQAGAVMGHTAMVEDSVGGTELDKSKLTPEQLAKRETAEGAIGYLKSKTGYGILIGELSPESDTPDFLKNLKQTQIMLEGELTRLATMGQGAVAQGVREHVNQTIGELAASPSVKNLLSATKTIKDMSRVIANMEMVGKPDQGLINPALRAPAATGAGTPGQTPAVQRPAAQGAPSPSDAPSASAGQVATPATKADYDALPAGTRYKAPDGSTRTKP